MTKILTWLVVHRNKVIKAILGVSVGLLLLFGINLYKLNKKLSESLEMALNNIEAYLGSLLESLLANNVLKLSVDELQSYNDKLVKQIDSVRNELKIKPKQLSTAATLTLIINVNSSKGVRGDIITIIKDSIYQDSIKYNDFTTIKYTIGKDTVSVGLDIYNTQYLYIFTDRQYKNKKSFIKRLFTFDFKKINRYKYKIINTNDLLQTEDVRIIELTNK